MVSKHQSTYLLLIPYLVRLNGGSDKEITGNECNKSCLFFVQQNEPAHYLVNRYGISVSPMTTGIFHLS